MKQVYTNNHKNTTPGPVLENIPDELAARRQWAPWRYEGHDKVPYTKTHRRASTTDPETWSRFDKALNVFARNRYEGIGFVFSEEDEYTFIDLDKCRDPKTGAIAEWALDWIAKFEGAYIEVSVSGTGIHIISRGRIRNRYLPNPGQGGRMNRKERVEMYSWARFSTISGDVLGEVPEKLPNLQDALDEFSEKYFAPKVRRENPTPTEPVDLADEELWEKARSAGGGMGELFVKLHDHGDFSDFPSHSEARFEYLKNAAFWTGWDAVRMSHWYEASALIDATRNHEGKPKDYRRKWERVSGQECERAMAAQPKAWRQSPEEKPPELVIRDDHLSRAIGALKARSSCLAWEGRTGPTDRHVYDALILRAERYGSIHEKGIVVSADVRNLALEAGTSVPTVRNALTRLADKELRNLVRVKKGTGRRPSKFLLLYPEKAPALAHKTYRVLYVQAQAAPYAQIRNRGPKRKKTLDKASGRKVSEELHTAERIPGTDGFVLLGRLGKHASLILQHVVEHCDASEGMPVKEIALGLNRKPYAIRRSKGFQLLVSEGLLIEVSEDRYAPPEDLKWRLDMELEHSGCNAARKRDTERYAREREAFRSSRREEAPVTDEGPTEEDMAARWWQRVRMAFDAIRHEGSGPNLAASDYFDRGEPEANFEYVVRSVPVYYKLLPPWEDKDEPEPDGWRIWEKAVRKAYALYFGEPSVGEPSEAKTEEGEEFVLEREVT